MFNSFIEDGKPEISELKDPIFYQYIFEFQILVENFGFPEYSIPIHELVKYIKYLVLCEIVLFLLAQVLEGAIGAIFHENVIVVIWKAFQRFNSNKVRMNWELSEYKYLLLYFLLLPVVFIWDNFGDQLLIGLIVSDSFFNDSESPLAYHLVIEDNKFQLLLVELLSDNKFCFFLHIKY